MLNELFVQFSAATLNVDKLNIPQTDADASAIRTVLTFVYITAGAISLLMVVLGGIRYIVSVGDPQRITTSKNTIIYALVGLIISLSAFVITAFIFDAISETPTDESIGYSRVIERML